MVFSHDCCSERTRLTPILRNVPPEPVLLARRGFCFEPGGLAPGGVSTIARRALCIELGNAIPRPICEFGVFLRLQR